MINNWMDPSEEEGKRKVREWNVRIGKGQAMINLGRQPDYHPGNWTTKQWTKSGTRNEMNKEWKEWKGMMNAMIDDEGIITMKINKVV